MFLSIHDSSFFLAWEHSILNIMSGPWGPGEVHCPVWGVTLLRMKNNELIILMFQKVLNIIGIFPKISYTLWNLSLILSHPPSLLGQCPKFDRIFFFMASLSACTSLMSYGNSQQAKIVTLFLPAIYENSGHYVCLTSP